MRDLTVWNTIKKTLERSGEFKNGRYEKATFTVEGYNYVVVAEIPREDGDIESGLYRNGKRYIGGKQKNRGVCTGYRKVHIKGTGVIFEHVLIAMALNPSIAEVFERDCSNKYTINHTKIYRRDKEARDKRRELNLEFDRLISEGCSFNTACEKTGCFEYDIPDKITFIDNLEVCTRADNTRHAHIVDCFDLYDISIPSALAIQLKDEVLGNKEVQGIINHFLKEHNLI